jgi:hypothetical protein
MADNDTLGTGLDTRAEPLASAYLDSEYMENADTIVDDDEKTSDGIDSATIGAAKSGVAPVVSVFESAQQVGHRLPRRRR